MPTLEESSNILNQAVAPDLNRQPNDMIPTDQPEPNIDQKDLISYLVKTTENDINDRDNFGFSQNLEYDLKAYYGVKDKFMMNWPHPNASAYPVPITPVHLDVGYTQIQNTMFRNPEKTVNVGGIGKEDRKYAPFVGAIHNWQNSVESSVYDVQSSNIFRTLLHGTGFVKTFLDVGQQFKFKHASVPITLIYKSIKGDGCQVDDCNHITQLIPLTENEWKFRVGLKFKGKSVYDDLEKIGPGFKPVEGINTESLKNLESQITGLDLESHESRDLRYFAETHLTYYPKNSFKPIELAVWWSLSGNMIHRVIVNKDKIRPFSDYKIYPNPGKAFHYSLPKKIRNVQEKANYTDKQITDASDSVIQPEVFITEGSGFDPNNYVKVLNGMYEVKRDTQIKTLERNISPIIQRAGEIDRLWREAEQLDGFTELFQGLQTRQSNTLGADKIRFTQSQGRFRTLLNTFGIGWANTCRIQYFYNDRYMPRKKAINILGSADYKNIEQVFPKEDQTVFGLGFSANLNYSIAGKTQDEVDYENAIHEKFLNEIIEVYGEDVAVKYKAMQEKAEMIDFKRFEVIVNKPIEVDDMGVDEMLQRIESGEKEIIPSPAIDRLKAIQYIVTLESFKRYNDRYKNYTPDQQSTMARLIDRLNAIYTGAQLSSFGNRAKNDPQTALALEEISAGFGRGAAMPPAPPPIATRRPLSNVA